MKIWEAKLKINDNKNPFQRYMAIFLLLPFQRHQE